ncbi:MAG: DUF2283 domain-containing protein [Peptococcaceae bacterium]|jgi:uncharacterized protein YuzE|nr:DUF2283 domain-containing protein [Peptococcaceae bacterium]
MKITYDQDVDVLYIELREAEPKDSIDLEEGITVDLDENKHVIGLEILDARERLGEKSLVSLSLEHLPLMVDKDRKQKVV